MDLMSFIFVPYNFIGVFFSHNKFLCDYLSISEASNSSVTFFSRSKYFITVMLCQSRHLTRLVAGTLRAATIHFIR